MSLSYCFKSVPRMSIQAIAGKGDQYVSNNFLLITPLHAFQRFKVKSDKK